MLEYLHIRNLALIEDVALEFSPGINVLTGETGAGKSFILKALSFLLGDRLKADMVRPDAERAIVEGLFQTPAGEEVIRRELIAETGRSRIFVNDTLHSQDVLKERRRELITYTSQHAQQQLLQPAFQSRLVEQNFPEPELLSERDRVLEALRDLERRKNDLLERQKNLLERRDLLEMQQTEIAKVAPREGEEEELEALRKKIREREQIAKSYDAAQSILLSHEPPGLLENLSALEKQLTLLAPLDENISDYVNSCLDFRAHLDALSAHLRMPPSEEETLDLDALEARLYAFAQLKRKLHRSIPEILALSQELEQSLSFLDSCTLDLSLLEKEEEELLTKLKDIVARILPLRRSCAESFCRNLEAQLKDLAFSEQVRVLPDYLPVPLYADVTDERIRFLWAPNPGQSPQPLDHIASGGELSRFLLALTSLQTRDDHSTYIFDEVDAGVGGYTLTKLSEKLEELASHHQIVLITHWPQLAQKAQRHFQIRKTVTDSVTSTTCHLLSCEERREELSRMAGGGKLGSVYTNA